MTHRLSFIPVPVAHVLRDGKRYLVDAKDIIVSDVVFLDSKISGVIPADIILYETSEDFIISSYLDTFDVKGKHLYELRAPDYVIPETATKKMASISTLL